MTLLTLYWSNISLYYKQELHLEFCWLLLETIKTNLEDFSSEVCRFVNAALDYNTGCNLGSAQDVKQCCYEVTNFYVDEFLVWTVKWCVKVDLYFKGVLQDYNIDGNPYRPSMFDWWGSNLRGSHQKAQRRSCSTHASNTVVIGSTGQVYRGLDSNRSNTEDLCCGPSEPNSTPT